tara:strand:- start:123 stop:362 length:240 start_codon:yes stop_codon:yes gene_type:complete
MKETTKKKLLKGDIRLHVDSEIAVLLKRTDVDNGTDSHTIFTLDIMELIEKYIDSQFGYVPVSIALKDVHDDHLVHLSF